MITIIKNIINGVEVVNSLFDFKNNIKKEDDLKLYYHLIYTGGTMWTKNGCYEEVDEISFFIDNRSENEQEKYLSYPMGDNKHFKVFAGGFHEQYHLLIKNDGKETITNILIRIKFDGLVMRDKDEDENNKYNWVYEDNDGYLGAYRGMKLIIDKLPVDEILYIPFNINRNDLYANTNSAKMSINIAADKCNKISHEYPVDIV